jgi:hypothetical protein
MYVGSGCIGGSLREFQGYISNGSKRLVDPILNVNGTFVQRSAMWTRICFLIRVVAAKQLQGYMLFRILHG